MNSITVKRVKCGDSSTIKINDRQIIIDCGSDNRNDDLESGEFAYSTIKKEIANKYKTDLLITHFHKDHFNGILHIPQMNNKLEHIYLPYSIIKGNNVYTGVISKLLVIAPPRSWGFELSSQIIKLFLKLEELVTNPLNIEFLKYGNTINFENKSIRILWPDCNFDIKNLKVKDIEIFDNKTAKYILTTTNQEQDNNNFNTKLSLIDERLENEYQKLLDNIKSNDYNVEEIKSAQNQLEIALECYLNTMHSGERLEGFYNGIRDQLKNAYDKSQETNRNFWNRISKNKLLMTNVKKFSKSEYHHLINTMNAISIVCDYDDQFIFLGDVNAEIISHIKPLFKNSYQVVKVQHHGTKEYYTNDTPKGKQYIISNGGYKRRKVGEQFISSIKTEQILCTNAHDNAKHFCYYNLHHGKCKNTCYKMNKEEIILIK